MNLILSILQIINSWRHNSICCSNPYKDQVPLSKGICLLNTISTSTWRHTKIKTLLVQQLRIYVTRLWRHTASKDLRHSKGGVMHCWTSNILSTKKLYAISNISTTTSYNRINMDGLQPNRQCHLGRSTAPQRGGSI